MDITSFVVQGRDQALLYGDYSTYHANLTRRLLSSRKKIGIATKNRGKYSKRNDVTAEDVTQNQEYVHLILLTSERAWAQAMSYKSSHSADQKGVTGRTRSHIISRLDKAARAAESLSQIVTDPATGANTNDSLEAKAYASMLRGAMYFEKQSWETCLRNYATARVIYGALATASKGDIFQDLLSETIDPSIRYAAYQLKTPRTVPIPIIARKTFPRSDESLTKAIEALDPRALKQTQDMQQGDDLPEGDGTPRTLTWRSREVKIEDAEIATAWGSVLTAKSKLADKLRTETQLRPNEAAAAYDEVLMTTQDAVDATKHAIDELRAEGVGQSDPRMQSLQITRTAVNYEMINWRIGRNRVLTGEHDGATEAYSTPRRGKKKQHEMDVDAEHDERDPPSNRKLAKLKEKAALYDGTIQNLDSIKELPGVAADEKLAAKLDAYSAYFEALKALAIARSHAIVGNVKNALALIDHCQKLNGRALTSLSDGPSPSSELPLDSTISQSSAQFLNNLLNGELQRHRAIVHIDNLRQKERDDADTSFTMPLADRLHEYPTDVNVKNIIQFPPKMTPIPIKPIFLDVAWSYIDYPGRAQAETVATPSAAGKPAKEEQPQQQPKRGWFGFGR